ncbi:hypothetical protein SLS64_010505 [Diaporthe eres]|uniref:NAD-dependent epimerase/dehydratase domain-containing protein n=1 Tax=Diaporthe eres TaxID=83184 RepID=A0ABR1PEV3_DIAER
MLRVLTKAYHSIGLKVVEDLQNHGHQVIALVRSEASAKPLKALKAETLVGSVEDVAVLRQGAQRADGVIHFAFVHDFSNMSRGCQIDRAAIEAMSQVMAGTMKPLVIASGTLIARDPVMADEDTPYTRDGLPLSERAVSSDLLFKLSEERAVRGMVIRVPPIHGVGDTGMLAGVIKAVRASGKAIYVDGGQARWPSAHRDDVAALTRLVLESGKAGSTYNAVSEPGVAWVDIMAAIGEGLGMVPSSGTYPEVKEALGFFADIMSLDNPTSGTRTAEELGWKPTGLRMLEDLRQNYF